jgi:hypothetical protein
VEDHDEPGVSVDRFWIEVKDKDRSAVIDMSMLSPVTDNTVLLDGGNIVVPPVKRQRFSVGRDCP